MGGRTTARGFPGVTTGPDPGAIGQKEAAPAIELKHNRMVLQIRPGTTDSRKQAVLDEWYRARVKEAVPPLITRWEPLMGVKVERFFVQRMKTKWGSCRAGSTSIRLNSDLAKKPRECLEYIVVHEMVHKALRDV